MGELTLGQFILWIQWFIRWIKNKTLWNNDFPLLEAIQYIDRICADDYFLLLCIKLSNVPIKEMMMLKGCGRLSFLAFGECDFNLFWLQESHFHIGFLRLLGRHKISIFMALRLVYLVVGSSVLTLTTTPNALTDGLEKERIFKDNKIPVHELQWWWALLFAIPILVEERTRSEGTDGRALILKQKYCEKSKGDSSTSGAALSAFHRATDLAMAMEAGIMAERKNKDEKPLRYTKLDHIAYLVLILC